MLVGLLGQMGAGKSTIAAIIAKRMSFVLFDMDYERPEEFRERNRRGEVVPASEVKEYQREMVARLIPLAKSQTVVFAGFFLDDELPKKIERAVETIWINLVTNNRTLLEQRVFARECHFATPVAKAIFDANWDRRHEFEFGTIRIDCGQPLEKVVRDCLDWIPHT